MGENGAGKSTLIKVVTGVYEKDAGRIIFKWKADPLQVAAGSAKLRDRHGLSGNIPLLQSDRGGEYVYRPRPIRFRSMETNERKRRLKCSTPSVFQQPDPGTFKLFACGPADDCDCPRDRLDCKILILDEPTSSLDEDEVKKLFELMRDEEPGRRRSSLLPTLSIRSTRSATGLQCFVMES